MQKSENKAILEDARGYQCWPGVWRNRGSGGHAQPPGAGFLGFRSLDAFLSAVLIGGREGLSATLFPLVRHCPGSTAASSPEMGREEEASEPGDSRTAASQPRASALASRPRWLPLLVPCRAGSPRPRARASQGAPAALRQDGTQRKVPFSPARSAAAGTGDTIQPLFA